MQKRRMGMMLRLGAAILCFIMAALSFLGIGTKDERHGPLLFGLMWICLGVLFAIRFFMEKEKEHTGDSPE
jgi:threonine/homoserine/homoserine lactone efflux protein